MTLTEMPLLDSDADELEAPTAEDFGELQGLFETLPVIEQLLITEHVLKGKPIADIARQKGLHPDAVTGLIERGLSAMRQSLPT